MVELTVAEYIIELQKLPQDIPVFRLDGIAGPMPCDVPRQIQVCKAEFDQNYYVEIFKDENKLSKLVVLT